MVVKHMVFCQQRVFIQCCDGLRVFFHTCFKRAWCLTNINTVAIVTLDLIYNSSGILFLDPVFWFFQYVRDGTYRFMGDLDVEATKNVCNSFGKTFGVREDNKTTMVDIICFLLSTRLAQIVNKICRVVISGEGFRYSLSFPWYFLLGGSNISNTRDSVSSGYPNTEKRVENTTRSGVFLTKFEVFG